MKEIKNIAFIINPMAGTQNKRRMPKLIADLMDKRQWLENIVFTQHVGHATELSRQYALMGFDVVVAVGGDGTVSEVAAGIEGTNTALGIIPMGTENTFARHIGLPLRGAQSIAWLNRSVVEPCDIMVLSDAHDVRVSAVSKVRATEAHVAWREEGRIDETEHADSEVLYVLNSGSSQHKNVKNSIQDGVAEIVTADGGVHAMVACTLQGEALSVLEIDGEEREMALPIRVEVREDGLKILVPKRY